MTDHQDTSDEIIGFEEWPLFPNDDEDPPLLFQFDLVEESSLPPPPPPIVQASPVPSIPSPPFSDSPPPSSIEEEEDEDDYDRELVSTPPPSELRHKGGKRRAQLAPFLRKQKLKRQRFQYKKKQSAAENTLANRKCCDDCGRELASHKQLTECFKRYSREMFLNRQQEYGDDYSEYDFHRVRTGSVAKNLDVVCGCRGYLCKACWAFHELYHTMDMIRKHRVKDNSTNTGRIHPQRFIKYMPIDQSAPVLFRELVLNRYTEK